MREAHLSQELDSSVKRWAFDPVAGLITAHNETGQLLMTLPAGPQFPGRLVQAFRTATARPGGANQVSRG